LRGKNFGGKTFWRENFFGGKSILAGKVFWRERNVGGNNNGWSVLSIESDFFPKKKNQSEIETFIKVHFQKNANLKLCLHLRFQKRGRNRLCI
jgi:hypothetical protein